MNIKELNYRSTSIKKISDDSYEIDFKGVDHDGEYLLCDLTKDELGLTEDQELDVNSFVEFKRQFRFFIEE